MEVNDTARLVLRHLGEGNPGGIGEGSTGHADRCRQLPAEVDGQPAPEVAGVSVEQHCTGVVVALPTERLADDLVPLLVSSAAGQTDAVFARSRSPEATPDR